MKRLLIVAAVASLSACAHAPSTQISELDEARSWIEKAKSAGAEKCAPAQQAKAVAYLHHAAHEYTETGMHPDENAYLVKTAVASAKEAYEVAKKGCNKPAVIALEGVFFETNSATLTAASAAILDKAAATLNVNKQIEGEVAAHTDDRGKDTYNLDLSNRRAASVMDYLVSHGVDAARLTSKGYGEAQPKADNATAAGRAQNRRVELRVK